MYRTLALFRPATASLRSRLPVAAAPLRRSPVLALQASSSVSAKRSYAAAAGLSKDDIQSRVLEVMKTFEKVDGGKLSPTAAFTSDLGLDSLDSVEVVMAIEEEFGIEIPDEEADKITTVAEAIDYIGKTSEAH